MVIDTATGIGVISSSAQASGVIVPSSIMITTDIIAIEHEIAAAITLLSIFSYWSEQMFVIFVTTR